MFSPPVASPKKAAHEPYAAARRTRETAVSRALRPMPTIGNQATVRILPTRVHPAIQTKLVVDHPGDPLEQEADRVAEHVTLMAQPSGERKCACGGTCAACRKEHRGELQNAVQRRAVGTGGAGPVEAPGTVHAALRSPSQALDRATRAYFEPRFGYEFSGVQVHAGPAAAASARELNAHAYTLGQDVVFGASRFAPGTDVGRRLLAHELAHVVQQTGPAQHAGSAYTLQRKTGPKADEAKVKACMAQKDAILPQIGFAAEISRESELNDALGADLPMITAKIQANNDARRFVCTNGVPGVLALWDTLAVSGSLNVAAAGKALAADPDLYSKNLDTGWSRRRRLSRAKGEIDTVSRLAEAEATRQGIPVLLSPQLPADSRGLLTGAAVDLEKLGPIFEDAVKHYPKAHGAIAHVPELIDRARHKVLQYRADPASGDLPTKDLDDALAGAVSAWQELDIVNRGFDMGGLVNQTLVLTASLRRFRDQSVHSDPDDMANVAAAARKLRTGINNAFNAVQNLNGAPGRWAFVLRYLAALNTPGFAGAPDAQTTESMRGNLGNLSSDFSALFDTPNLSQFLDEFSGRIGEQIEVRHTIETATHKQTEMVPGQTDVRAFFASLAKASNADVSRAYTDYAQAFFEHRIVNRPDDLNVHGLNEIFARPLSAAGLRPLVCTGYAMLGADLFAAAGGTVKEFIVAVRASDQQLRDGRLDDGHALAVIQRNGQTRYISNHLVVETENDGIGPDAVAWDHKNFPLITARGPTVQEAIQNSGTAIANKTATLQHP